MQTPPYLPAWNDDSLDRIAHGFFGRAGGVSTGLYDSLNVGVGSGDDPAAVTENRRRVRAAMGACAMVSAYQVHGAQVAFVTEPWDDKARPECDGLVTDRPGIALCILTADCVPVLFADDRNGIIGAAHAGWKGALAGVCEATLAAMVELGSHPRDIVAAIGPAIQQLSYEVGPDLRDSFLEESETNGLSFAKGRADRWQFDLTGYVKRKLQLCGLGRIEVSDIDTCADQAWFSNRRRTHRGEPDYGRNASVILLSPE